MNRRTWKAALFSAIVAAGTLVRPAAADEGLTLKRVLLSSGGVGYFEYEAVVHEDADLPLAVPLDQVDDVLKSIVVYDTHGSVGEISLPAKATADGVFRDLPFDAAALASEPDLLEALRGAEVQVTTASATLDGRILSVTEELTRLPDGTTIPRHRLALLAGGAMTSVIVEDTRSLTVADPTLKHQIETALASLLDQKERGRRSLVVHTAGEGERRVRVGYVVAVPLWKTTYRLTLPADPQEKTATLQGWAVVENQSGTDWNRVDLTLVSGSPVTFRQALYESYYVDRPEVPVEVVGRVLPRLETGALSVTDKLAPSPASPPAAALRVDGRWGAFNASPAEEAPAPPPAAVTPASSIEEATQVVFHLPDPVSLPSAGEGLLPIVSRPIPAERVSLLQPDVDARHPLASVQLVNDGATGLPPGVVTTYERAADGTVTYTGDARLATLPAGEKRLLSFGVDAKVTVDRRDHEARTITLATLADGVLSLTRAERRVTGYTLAGAAREPRVVILEHPRLAGFELTAPANRLVGATDRFYQLRVEIPAGATVSLQVSLERPVSESVTIADLPAAALGAYVGSTELSRALRDALARVADLRTASDEKAAAVKDLEAEVARIHTDQARIRDNLKAVPAGSPLAERYLGALAQQEDRLAALDKQLVAARSALQAADEALSASIRSLHI